MSVYGVKLPDVGEGVAEAELIEWYVDVGDRVTPDTVLADVMTDKATVEISSPVTGVVTFRVGEPGEVLAVGTEFVGVEIEGSDPAPIEPVAPPVDAADPPAESPPPGTAPVELPQPDTVPVDAPQPDAEAPAPSGGDTLPRPSTERRPTAAPVTPS